MPKSPKPDEFGHIRVRDRDTGHELTVTAITFGHGNYEPLSQPASNLGGDPLPPKHATESLSSLSSPTTTSGQQAEPKKEIDHA